MLVGDRGGTAVTAEPSRRARQKAETRSRLLETATDVFLDQGPITASLDVVAERAGVSKATVFFHFGSRVQLMAELAHHLYLAFRFEAGRPHRTDLRSFLRAYLRDQKRPEVRLIWQLGDLLAADQPEGLDAAYWHLVREIEERLVDAGLAEGTAHDRSLVLTPALMLVARRAAFDLAAPAEMRDFVAAACGLALGNGTGPDAAQGPPSPPSGA
jgi:AcrR family transcriptional regulator